MTETGNSMEAHSKPLELTRQELDRVLDQPAHTPEDVVNLFQRDFNNELSSLAGGWEQYTLREHTLMVLEQFHKYFKDKLPDGISRNFFEVVLVLHDMGKPQAARDGQIERQHEYTSAIIQNTLGQLEFTDAEIAIAIALIDGDPLGDYLQFGLKDEAIAKVSDMARKSGLQISDFFNMLKIYYQVDAGSYTTDARGKDSLDHVFSFDPVRRSMDFAPLERARIAELESLLGK